MKKLLIVILVVVAFLGIWAVSARNNLVTLEEGVKEKWSQVENVYQRRLDLIPNLVNTVKGYATHERETLEGVVEARAKATQISGDALKNVINDPQAFQKFQESQSALSSALSRLMVVVERYPDLKANQNFLELQSQLEGTENRIAVERRRYNETAKDFNVAIRRFPTAMIASFFGFKEKAYFQAEAGAAKAPEVKF
jgi:LemA protein